MESKRLAWVSKSQAVCGSSLVIGGRDKGNKLLHVARAKHLGGVIPGKLISGATHVAIPYGGKEIWYPEYELLTAPHGTLSWVEVKGGKVPCNAVQGGKDPNGDTYYIGRAKIEDTVTVGKVHAGICFLPFGNKEHSFHDYEILVINEYGRLLNI